MCLQEHCFYCITISIIVNSTHFSQGFCLPARVSELLPLDTSRPDMTFAVDWALSNNDQSGHKWHFSGSPRWFARPGITVMVDWAFKINYLSISGDSYSVMLGLRCTRHLNLIFEQVEHKRNEVASLFSHPVDDIVLIHLSFVHLLTWCMDLLRLGDGGGRGRWHSTCPRTWSVRPGDRGDYPGAPLAGTFSICSVASRPQMLWLPYSHPAGPWLCLSCVPCHHRKYSKLLGFLKSSISWLFLYS